MSTHTSAQTSGPLLQIENLTVEFETLRGQLRAIDGVSFDIRPGETVSLVGESGCGKSITSLAVMGLLPANGRVATGRIPYEGRDLLTMSERERLKLRGGDIAMIFQDPMTSLNPSFTVGFQLMETLRAHARAGAPTDTKSLREQCVKLLQKVGIPEPTHRLDAYPHQLSGGMSQRVMIAMAIACEPKVLIADEPTTALDVTIQAQVLELLKSIQRESGMAIILITHDLGVVAEMADRVNVMYAGQIVESGETGQVIDQPRHPYTRGLLDSLPASHRSNGEYRTPLSSIPGLVPDLLRRPSGCQLNPRCSFAEARCRESTPALERIDSRLVRCFKPLITGGVQ
jgi:dipeptide transport system ATP-binding protein